MGLFTFIVAVLSVTLIFYDVADASNCPPPSKISTRTPTCVQDSDCKDGKICCLNISNAKSCVDRYTFSRQDKPKNVDSNSALGYCDGVKCMSYEVCKPDRHTGKLKCQLP